MGSQQKDLAVSERQTRLGDGHLVQLSSTSEGAALTVRRPDGQPSLEIEISMGPHGPVARLRTAALEIEATEAVDVRCRAFRVEASEDVTLHSQASVKATGATVALEASVGSVVARANDDVQLLGENILLNCDRTAPVPDWVTAPAGAAVRELLAREEASGDAHLIATVSERIDPGDASS